MLRLNTNHWSLITALLLRFLVRLVLPAAITELLELKTARGRLLVLRRRVIPLLALSALQRNNFPHFNSFPENSPKFLAHSSKSIAEPLLTASSELRTVNCEIT
jgi:hypothetical protein